MDVLNERSEISGQSGVPRPAGVSAGVSAVAGLGEQIPDAAALVERRAHPRYLVDCAATLTPVGGAARIAGRLSNLSLGGCLVVSPRSCPAGMPGRVEVQFQLRGIAFRVMGVIVGWRGAQSLAVRFQDLPERRREELSEVLDEVAAIRAAKAADGAADLNGCGPVPTMLPEPEANPARSEILPANPLPLPAKPQDRRAHRRLAVETTAKLLLVKTAISMPGRILNLSLGGCRIRTDQPFNVGIFVRVETEFYLHGLPFRIAGVSQAIQDRNTIGVRFLNMSERRRGQLLELIAEIDEARALEPDEP